VGVEPDIEVIDDPAGMNKGRFPQVDAAIRRMMAELRNRPSTRLRRPTAPGKTLPGRG
jgi:hypothetical protein